ncbi:MAG: CDP-alcohol phosphatidyltransferase family protein [Lysobacterales bacterium]
MAERRPLKSRASRWAGWLTQRCLQWGLTPNQISLLSIASAVVGAGLMWLDYGWSLVLAAICVQLRLLCNLLDGMVAVEGGQGTPSGALYNEVPDRVADSLFLIAAGYAAGMPWLGWLAALLAALTAYVRLLGGSLGLPQDFSGPQAKPHRMALLTVSLLLSAFQPLHWPTGPDLLWLGLILLTAGTAWTVWRRLRRIANALSAGAARSA